MFLLEIVGMTCTNHTFNIGFAFMSKEDQPHFAWVLGHLRKLYEEMGVMPTAIMTDREQALINAIHEIFTEDEVQHLLCWVHITSNIKKHALEVFEDDPLATKFSHRFWGLFMSTTEESYEAKRRQILKNWHSGLVGYVDDTWLKPYKRNIVRAWTDNRLHFFTRTTNR